MAGALYQSQPVGVLTQEPEGALGPALVNPLLARQIAAQRLVPKASPIFPNALTSWSQLGPALNQYARQNFPIDSPEAVRQAAFQTAMSNGPLATVFHGSPHRFDKFDMGKVGTGEGAQAYGHGLYFAENPKVAKEYAKVNPSTTPSPVRLFKGQELTPGTPEYHAGTLLEHTSLDRARKEVARWIAEGSPDAKLVDGWRKTLQTLNQATSKADFKVGKNQHLYKVDLPDDQIAKMLDWDKPLSQQPEQLKNSIAGSKYAGYFGDGRTVGQAYQRLARDHGGEDLMASGILQDLGVSGIKYLDQGSRAGGKGTHNYVVFDDKIPRIIGRE